MDYFDILTSGYFKTGKDGRKLFYPRGAWGRGYVVASEADEKRLRQQIKGCYVVILVLLIGGYALQGYLGAILIGAILTVFYLVFTPYLVRGLQPSTERLSVSESVTAQAQGYNPVILWSMEILMLVLLGFSIVMVFDESANRLAALGLIAMFGFCAAVFMWMLVLRRRAGQH